MTATSKPEEYFLWDKIGLDESLFRATTSLISIRNGGRVDLSVPDISEDKNQIITRLTYPPEHMSRHREEKFCGCDKRAHLNARYGCSSLICSTRQMQGR